jgi:hypothetical protein
VPPGALQSCRVMWVALFALLVGAPGTTEAVDAEVKVTQKYLQPTCLDGSPVKDARHWRLSLTGHRLSFTMKNEPRHAASPEASAGYASVRFTPEAGHRYEIEVRAEPTSFSERVWKRGEWKPVVRDRTTDEIVTSEPEWDDEACR